MMIAQIDSQLRSTDPMLSLRITLAGTVLGILTMADPQADRSEKTARNASCKEKSSVL